MNAKTARAIILACFLLLATECAALAHAYPDHSEPRVGCTVTTPPGEVKIWFNGDLIPAGSEIRVLSADGVEIDRRDSHLDGKDPSLLIVSLPPRLSPGIYHVVWKAMNTDTHRTHGEFKFEFKP